MYYIDSFEEFNNKIDEKIRIPHRNRVGNEIATLLGNNARVGKEIFKTINKNVETLENLIENFNEKHKNKIQSNPLAVEIDKAKLNLEYLISLTKLKRTPFITDVIVSNILNYKILIRPIKNAKIITLAYKYYLALVRHALQNALIMIELSSDMFFTQINAYLTGRRRQMHDMINNITEETRQLVIDAFSGKDLFNTKTGKAINIKNIIGGQKLKEITQLIKSANTANRTMNDYDRTLGYSHNVFQDFGNKIESQIKTNQDKEIHSLAERLTNIANSTVGLTKDNQASAKEQVTNYANAIKFSAEARAMEICAQINLNMFEIIKLFTLRNIDNFGEVFTQANIVENQEEKFTKTLDDLKQKHQEEMASLTKKLTSEANDIEMSDEDKQEILTRYKDKGINELCTPSEFRNIFKPGNDVKSILKKNKFTDSQIDDILKDGKVSDYGKIYYEDLREYIKTLSDDEISNLKWKDDKSKDDDEILCWMRKDSINYKKFKDLNS